MQVFWNGTDITEYCNVTGCVHRDAAGGKNDTLELQLDRASVWYRWGPEEGDEIEIRQDGFTTGILYLTAAIPTGDQYRILAGSVKPEAVRKAWGGFENVTLKQIMERCSTECGMTGKIFGGAEDLTIPYAMRKGEGCAAFLDRICTAEGYKLKAYNGAFRAIALEYAEEQEPAVRLTITGTQDGIEYRRRKNLKYSGITVISPWAKATARDTNVDGSNIRVITTLPAMNAMQAGRWARNLLKDNNRQAEEVLIDQRLNTNMTALSRVSIDGGTDMDGEWIIEESEHDLKNKNTTSKLYRVIDSIR